VREPVHDMTGRVKDRWEAARRSSLDRRNMRLRDEVIHLRTRLDDERSQSEDLKDALRSNPKVIKVKKRGLLRVAIVGGAAYVIGTRDGRDRYEQIVSWVRSMRSRMERKADDVVAGVEGTASEIEGVAEEKLREAQSAGQAAARTAAQRPTASAAHP
jgi:hypothetical protein